MLASELITALHQHILLHGDSPIGITKYDLTCDSIEITTRLSQTSNDPEPQEITYLEPHYYNQGDEITFP